MRLLLVFNPHAALGRARRLLPEVRGALEAFASLDVLLTQRRGHAGSALAGLDLRSYDGVIAAGGDGTLFEVVNGLCGRSGDDRAPLGVVPVGTGNAFARDLGLLPGDWARGIGIVRSGRLRPVDVGRVVCAGAGDTSSYYFLNIVGAGLPVDAMRTAERIKLVGAPAYSIAALWHALRLRSHRFRLELDGEVVEEEALFVEVSNTRYTGTSFLMAPAAACDDGLLDVTLVRRLSRRRLLRLFPTIYSGRHVGHPEVLTRRARRIRIMAPAGLALAPDGEFRGHAPAVISCLHRELRMFG
jgi:diacylglycerol kinase (ATP)